MRTPSRADDYRARLFLYFADLITGHIVRTHGLSPHYIYILYLLPCLLMTPRAKHLPPRRRADTY